MLHRLPLPVTLSARVGDALLRHARAADLDAIIRLLADDPVSAGRGDVARNEDRPSYERAFGAIEADPANSLLVATTPDELVVGTMQLTAIPGMARLGSTRLQVEAVRVRSDLRSSGIGGAMMRWVLDAAAPALDASLVQLTSDASRVDAHRLYERLGFTPSHRGFKYDVPR